MIIPEDMPIPSQYDVVSCRQCGFCFADVEANQDDYNLYYRNSNDYSQTSDLKQFLRIWNKFMNQAILLRDKAQVYGEENKAMFDGFAEQFYALEDEYEMLTGNKYKED